jgi:CheY-like chemotaxis protein
LSKISYSCQILLNVINDILDFSKIEAGKLEIEKSYFSFASLFDSLLAVASLRASEKNLNLRLYVDPHLPTHAYGDPLRMSQIILNLVNNAIKFTRVGGVVISFNIQKTPHTSSGDIEQTVQDFMLVVRVKDTGIGITPENLEKIFLPFSQADGSTSREFGGTGLGLSIVTQLAALMDGNVAATSVAGKGSEFTCNIKLEKDKDTHGLIENQLHFNRQVLYFIEGEESLLSSDYLKQISCAVSIHPMGDMKEVINDFDNKATLETSEQSLDKPIILLDIENGKKARLLHEQIIALQKEGVSIGCVTNTQPEHLRTILHSQWNCPVISHPFTPTELLLFANQLYGSDSFFASHSNERSQLGLRQQHQVAQSINTSLYEGHVLLVEDNSINQLVAGEMLHSFGLTFDIAEDGQQALTKVQNSPHYDLILMDIQMPIMDGNTATKAIREAGHTDIPIVGLSANAMKQDFSAAKTSGMNEYLTKPIKRETLREMVAHYLSERETK